MSVGIREGGAAFLGATDNKDYYQGEQDKKLLHSFDFKFKQQL